MKKIGQGWQYTVYDLENGKVLKKFHSWIRAYFVIFREIFPFDNDSLFEIPSFIKDMKRKADESFEILKRVNIPQEWMANPKFINKYDFEQDKVVPLHNVFDNLDTDGIKRIIDQFIELNKKLMSLGFIDKSFNITRNYGLNSKKEIVLIDIGELFDDNDLIDKQIKNRVWKKSYVSGRIKNKEAREYFVNEMDRNFS
jgi:hypothetical protein